MNDCTTSVVAHGGIVAVAALGLAAHRRLRRRSPKLAGLVVPVAVGATWAVIDQAERRRPFKREWREDHDGDTRSDLAFSLAAVVPAGLGQVIGRRIGRRVGLRVSLESLPAPVAVPLAVVAYDLFHTSYHRLFHEWGPGWTVHSVHHSPTRLYWFNALRFHVLETLLDTVGETIIGAVFQLSADQHVAYLITRGAYGQLQHCNIALDSGPLNRVFATPDLHRWHHSVVYAEGDTNYGAVTSVWDQVFGSYFHPGRPLDSELGIGRMPDFPTTWSELQLVPLQWSQIKRRNAATWFVDDEVR